MGGDLRSGGHRCPRNARAVFSAWSYRLFRIVTWYGSLPEQFGLIMIDLLIVALAIVILVTVASRPHPARPTTALLLALLTGILLWANLRSAGWQEELGGVDRPVNLDFITKAMFWRGWPLSPCMVCTFHGSRFHPNGLERFVLVIDGAIFVVALFLIKAACERCLRSGKGVRSQ